MYAPGSMLLAIASACPLVAAAAWARRIDVSGHGQVNFDR